MNVLAMSWCVFKHRAFGRLFRGAALQVSRLATTTFRGVFLIRNADAGYFLILRCKGPATKTILHRTKALSFISAKTSI